MSQIVATVTSIENCDSLHIVKFDFHDQTLSMMSLELDPNIKINTKVKLTVKPTNIAIGKNFLGEISYSNQLICIINDIKNGQLLSSVKLQNFDTTLESIITCSSSKNLNLKVGDTVTAYIKANDISIAEVLS
ncbi:MAG: TOBE domain-containing protein [Arcobacteraceae bacterium]